MDNQFEQIVPWNGANDTGRDVRLKWQRNFERVKAGLQELLAELETQGGALDEIIAELVNFLRKDQPDSTKFLLSLLGGAIFGKDGFASGPSGFGAKIDENGNGEMESLYVRRFLEVPELRYNRVSVTMGDTWNAPGAGILESVSVDTDSEGNPLMTGTGVLKLEDGEIGAVDKGDICMGIFHSVNSEDNATENSDDSRGNRTFAGFYTAYFTVTEVSSDTKTFRYQLRPVSDRWKLAKHPCEAMRFVAYGNFTNTDRQTSTYSTRDYTRRLWKQNTWEIGPQNIAMQCGNLMNLTVHGMNMTGYSMYLNSVYFTGQILQTKPDGTPVRTANDRGAWKAGHYDYYDRVSHNGCIWLCVAENGTDSEPAKGNADWLLQVEKGGKGDQGEGGKDGTSIVWRGEFPSHPASPQNGWAYRNTSDGKSYTYRDGAWYVMNVDGIDGQNGKDGKDGISIVWKGDLATSPANPVKNWVYRDTDNGRVYIYNGNAWELMVVDGSDGMDGARGDDGLSVFITYHDGTTQPAAPTGNGTTDGWHTAATSTAIWMSQKVAASASEGTWGTPIKIKGEKGEQGAQGKPGKDGRGVEEVKNFYLATGVASGVTTDTAGWTEQVQDVTVEKRYLWNYEQVIYTDGSSVKTTPAIVGNYAADGQNGADGVGIVGVTEEYGVSTSQGTQPSRWELLPPDMDSTNKYLWNRETTKYTDNSTRTVTHLIAVYGDQGDSVSNLGDWKTGLFVPYLGIVRMGGASWQCTVKAGTTNPPLWTLTDKDGNRLLQTQDGGRTYGYILTGGENSAEYALMARDGEKGADGVGIPGKDGKTYYTWIRYADDAQGNGISNDPAGKAYIGISNNNETPQESDNPKDYAWALIKGEDGVGIPGKDGKTYYTWIAYSDNADGSGMYQQPTANTRYIGIAPNKETATESSKPEDYTWSKFRGDDGKDGEPGKDGAPGKDGQDGQDGTSVTHHGDWKTGLFVPYMGIVRMGNASWICTNPDGTTNPPLWTITDMNGNRLLQTQDGGKTYGYILTGGKNTADYALAAEDGKPGADGKPGQDGKPGADGKPGLQGCILRRGEWTLNTEYRNDEALTSGTRYLDVALVRDNATATGWRAYKCLQTHTSSTANAPGNTAYWEEFGANVTSLFTALIIAKDALIEFMSGNQLLIKKDNGAVVIGLTGEYEGKAYIWAGGATPAEARFRVDETGKVVAVDGEFSGVISGILASLHTEGNEIVLDPGRAWFNKVDLYNQGTVDGRPTRFYSNGIWGRGSFGARQRLTARIEGATAYYYPDGTDMPAVTVALTRGTSTDGNAYYTVPCYGLSGSGVEGMPVDTLVFRNLSARYNYVLDMSDTQRVVAINANDNGVQYTWLYLNGTPVSLDGGMGMTLQKIPPAWMNPAKGTNVLGRGILRLGSLDNDWS